MGGSSVFTHGAIQQAGDHEADHRQHAHQAEHIVVALLAGEVVQDRAIDHVGEHAGCRSEEHTSELQSRFDLVCRLLLEKKKKKKKIIIKIIINIEKM